MVRRALPLILFLLTLVTTTRVGMRHYLAFTSQFGQVPPALAGWDLLWRGGWYSLAVLAIFGAHEYGHVVACRAYGVAVSGPIFLPLPPVIGRMTGTLGAFLQLRGTIPHRCALIDIAMAGPVAGLFVTIPALIVGLWLSPIVPLPADAKGSILGEPLLFQWAQHAILGPVPAGSAVNLHPLGFAAWVGLLATGLNLFPIGQLDGGQVVYALICRRAAWVTLIAVGVVVGLMILAPAWGVWAGCVGLMLALSGMYPPPMGDETAALPRSRYWLAMLAVILFFTCLTPIPIRPA